MRFLYGLLAFFIWGYVLCLFAANGITMTDTTIIISLSIVVGGALAGGDGK